MGTELLNKRQNDIKIDKLIKLLNEYGDINWNKAMIEHQDTYIISKKFGFIEWLVENDKIKEKKSKLSKLLTDEDEYFEYTPGTNDILKELAISDTPIEDLILLLR